MYIYVVTQTQTGLKKEYSSKLVIFIPNLLYGGAAAAYGLLTYDLVRWLMIIVRCIRLRNALELSYNNPKNVRGLGVYRVKDALYD